MKKTAFTTFRNLCAWGIVWIFFIMLPLQSIRLVIKENKEPMYKVNMNVDTWKYCAFLEHNGKESLNSCFLRIGKRAGMEMTTFELESRLEEALGLPRPDGN